jgi:pSer/pThr/pTyr-binding forkhead associated (FHA) protein
VSDGPVLVGTDGFVLGEEFPIDMGSTVVIGRSRTCDISLRRCRSWLALDEERRESQDDFKSVSRKHIRISYYDSSNIEVEDLSSNGTFVDGRRINRTVITDIRERSYELLLGTRERFRLEWRSPE